MAFSLKNLFIFSKPFLAHRLFRVTRPVLAGYKITHDCNLRCRHCPYWKRSGPLQNFQGVINTLRKLRDLGVKIVIFEGGEPLLWRDGKKGFAHVVQAARELFPCVCATTNGILPWWGIGLDRTWVSLDGPKEIHDFIRGKGVFEKVRNNISQAGSSGTFVSTTINSFNVGHIPELVRSLKSAIQGMTIQFHYPYEGLPDPLFIPPANRKDILDELIDLKRSGFPVANSVLSLNDLKKKIWTCDPGLLANAEPDGAITQGCYLKNRGDSVCSCCGFSAHNELSLAFKGKPESIVAGMRIFFSPA